MTEPWPTVRGATDLAGLRVHIACLRPHGPTKYGYQACRCEVSPEWADCDVSRAVDLCTVCARGPAGGVSRWSWLGCDHCRAVELELRSWLGICVTSLGRHSIMNGVGRRFTRTSTSDPETFVRAFAGQIGGWTRLEAWGAAEAAQLAQHLPQGTAEVPLPEWTERFPQSCRASVDAYERMLGVPLPEDMAVLAERRLAEEAVGLAREARPNVTLPCEAAVLTVSDIGRTCGLPTQLAVARADDGRQRPLCLEHLLTHIGDGQDLVFKAQDGDT